jgi:hypothetical protein
MFDHQLEKALRRKTPPPGFENRVLRRLAETRGGSQPSRRRWIRTAGFGLAASLLIGIAGVRYVGERQAARAERNRQMVETALRVVSETLQAVQDKVAHASVIRGDSHEPRQP